MANGGDLSLGIKANNNDAESALGGCTQKIHRGNFFAIRSAASVSDATINYLFDRPIAPTKIVNHKNKKAYLGGGVVSSV